LLLLLLASVVSFEAFVVVVSLRRKLGGCFGLLVISLVVQFVLFVLQVNNLLNLNVVLDHLV